MIFQWIFVIEKFLFKLKKDHQGNFNIGAKCNFFCYDGFELEGMRFRPTTLKCLAALLLLLFTFLRNMGSKTNIQSDRLSLPNPGRWSSDLGNACLDVYFCLLACCLLAVLFTLTSSLSVLEILRLDYLVI